MKSAGLKPLAAVFAFSAIGCTAAGPRIKPDVRVPAEFAAHPVELPSGESEPVQYRKAYEAFWYNCVALRSENLGARCPSTCRGTPAAVSGCAHGGEEARSRIRESVADYGEVRTRRALRSIAAEFETKAKMAAYFGEHPTEEYEPIVDEPSSDVVR